VSAIDSKPDPAMPGPALTDERGNPTRSRKLKTLSFAQVDEARALIKPQPLPIRGERITFAPDFTPADPAPPDSRFDPAAMESPRKRTAIKEHAESPDQNAISAAREQISPRPKTQATGAPAANARTAPELSSEEMAQVIALVQSKYGPILSLQEASEVCKRAKQTLREMVCNGHFADSVVRGRPLRFWTHRFLPEAMK
jgi:hypothetical protein